MADNMELLYEESHRRLYGDAARRVWGNGYKVRMAYAQAAHRHMINKLGEKIPDDYLTQYGEAKSGLTVISSRASVGLGKYVPSANFSVRSKNRPGNPVSVSLGLEEIDRLITNLTYLRDHVLNQEDYLAEEY